MKHYSVLLSEIIDGLNIKPSGVYVDATLGYGGMSKCILEKLDANGLLIAIDQDKEAREYAESILKKISNNYEIVADNFQNIKKILEERNISKIDGIIFDLGFSSPQSDEPKRGFGGVSDAFVDILVNVDSK